MQRFACKDFGEGSVQYLQVPGSIISVQLEDEEWVLGFSDASFIRKPAKGDLVFDGQEIYIASKPKQLIGTIQSESIIQLEI